MTPTAAERARISCSQAALPLSVAAVLVAIKIVSLVTPIPDFAELFTMLKSLFAEWGTYAFVLSSFIEGLFIIGFHLPGSLVIVLGVLVSDLGLADLARIMLACLAGINAALVVDYFIGRYGIHRLFLALGGRDALSGAQAWIEKRGRITILLAAVHPNILALVIVCFGIAKAPFWSTMLMAFLATAIWVPISLGVAATLLRTADIGNSDPFWVVLGFMLAWAAVAAGLTWRRLARSAAPSGPPAERSPIR